MISLYTQQDCYIEILAMKTPVLKQIGQIAAEFNPDALAPKQC